MSAAASLEVVKETVGDNEKVYVPVKRNRYLLRFIKGRASAWFVSHVFQFHGERQLQALGHLGFYQI